MGAGFSAQRKDSGYIGNLADRNPVDKIFTAAVQNVANRQDIVSLLGDLLFDHRFLAEAEVVGRDQLRAL